LYQTPAEREGSIGTRYAGGMSSDLHPHDRVRQTLADPAKTERQAHWRSGGDAAPEWRVRFTLRELLLAVTSVGILLGLGCRSELGLFLAVQAIGLTSVGILCLRTENRCLLGPFDASFVASAATIAGIQIGNGYIFGYWGATSIAYFSGHALMIVSTVLFLIGLVTLLGWVFTVPAWRPGVLFRGWSRLVATTALIPITFHAAMVVGMTDRAGLFYADAFVGDCVTLWKSHRGCEPHMVQQREIPPAIKRVGPSFVGATDSSVKITRVDGNMRFRYGYYFSADPPSKTYVLRWFAEDLGEGVIQKGPLP
jgi:hypothetical protein